MTIMFTDVEGSTALRTTLGDAEADELFAEHDELIRAADRRASGPRPAGRPRRRLPRRVRFDPPRHRLRDRDPDVPSTRSTARAGPPLNVRIGLNTGEVAWQGRPAVRRGGPRRLASVRRRLTAARSSSPTSRASWPAPSPTSRFRDAGEHRPQGLPAAVAALGRHLGPRDDGRCSQQVFVGRDERARDACARELTSALDGSGGLVLVGGEPGVGKTTLVRQLIARSRAARRARCVRAVLRVRGHRPLLAVRRDARAGAGAHAAGHRARGHGRRRRRGGADGARAAAPLPRHPRASRPPTGAAAALLLQRVSDPSSPADPTRFPLVLVIDDIHWADEADAAAHRAHGGADADLRDARRRHVPRRRARRLPAARSDARTAAAGSAPRAHPGEALRPRRCRDDDRGPGRQGRRPRSSSTRSSTRPRATRSSSRRCSGTSSRKASSSTNRRVPHRHRGRRARRPRERAARRRAAPGAAGRTATEGARRRRGRWPRLPVLAPRGDLRRRLPGCCSTSSRQPRPRA